MLLVSVGRYSSHFEGFTAVLVQTSHQNEIRSVLPIGCRGDGCRRPTGPRARYLRNWLHHWLHRIPWRGSYHPCSWSLSGEQPPWLGRSHHHPGLCRRHLLNTSTRTHCTTHWHMYIT